MYGSNPAKTLNNTPAMPFAPPRDRKDMPRSVSRPFLGKSTLPAYIGARRQTLASLRSTRHLLRTASASGCGAFCGAGNTQRSRAENAHSLRALASSPLQKMQRQKVLLRASLQAQRQGRQPRHLPASEARFPPCQARSPHSPKTVPRAKKGKSMWGK